MDRLSIIIPAYNAERYLGKCVESIMKQTYEDVEIIIVDDASTDHTYDLIMSYAKEYDRIIGVKNEYNQGPSSSRQRGVDVATGRYITFVDADDWYIREDAIQIVMEKMREHKVDCLIYGYNAIHPHNIIIPHSIPCVGGYSADAIIEKREQTQSAIFHYVWNKVYDLELLRRENIRFDEKLRGAEDVQFNYEFVCKAKTFFLLNKRLYAYNCCNSNSITHGYHESSLNSEDAIRSIELLEGSYRAAYHVKIGGITYRNYIMVPLSRPLLKK